MALVVVATTIPIVRALAVRFRFYDWPGRLKVHAKPIPRLGGAAMALGLATALLVLREAASPFPPVGFLAAVCLVWAISFTDDLHELPPALRFVAHLGAGLLLWRAGWHLPILQPAVLNAAATCLLVAFFVSAFNMLDGADGIAGGTAAAIALGYIALPLGAISHFASVVAWSLLGTCLGFLLFNFPPAKIFMGDSGSAVLGFLVAFLGLDLYRSHPGYGGYSFMPLLFAAVPLADATLAVMRRLGERRSLFEGDRSHFYDLLLQRGWSQRRVALFCYTLTGFAVLLGWLCYRELFGAIALVIAGSAMLFAMFYLLALRSAVSLRSAPAVAKAADKVEPQVR